MFTYSINADASLLDAQFYLVGNENIHSYTTMTVIALRQVT